MVLCFLRGIRRTEASCNTAASIGSLPAPAWEFYSDSDEEMQLLHDLTQKTTYFKNRLQTRISLEMEHIVNFSDEEAAHHANITVHSSESREQTSSLMGCAYDIDELPSAELETFFDDNTVTQKPSVEGELVD